MIAPFYKFGAFGDEMNLILAFVIGIGFGFFLERAGFGSSRKLAAQFYFTDMTVFKVMFTAIVTAMIGVFFLSAIGFVDANLIYVSNTYLVPQIVGGLLLGIGFVIGGYCPGTSMVACSTGRFDGMFYIGGVFIGIFIFAELYPVIETFYKSTNMGKVTLPEYFGTSYGVIVFLVVLMAIGGFVGAEYLEKKIGYKKK